MQTTRRKEYMKIYNRQYNELHKNDERTKQQRRDAVRRYNANLRIRVFNIIGHKCVKCGFTDKRALQFDHIKGNGYLHKRKYSNLIKRLVVLLQDPIKLKEELQPMCANCNWIKRYENGEVNTTYEWKKVNNGNRMRS